MRRFTSFLLLLALPAVALAEEKKTGRTCRIVYPGAPEGAPEKLYLHDGKTTRPVELPSMGLSPVYQLAEGDLELRLMPEPPAGGEAPVPSTPKVGIAAGVKDVFLIVRPDPANSVAPVKLEVIDGGTGNFKAGGMFWVNFTDDALRGRVGAQELSLTAGERSSFGPPAEAVGEYEVNLVYRKPGGEGFRPFCEGKWLHDPAARTIFFVIDQPGGRPPVVTSVTDRPEPAGNPAPVERAGK